MSSFGKWLDDDHQYPTYRNEPARFEETPRYATPRQAVSQPKEVPMKLTQAEKNRIADDRAERAEDAFRDVAFYTRNKNWPKVEEALAVAYEALAAAREACK